MYNAATRSGMANPKKKKIVVFILFEAHVELTILSRRAAHPAVYAHTQYVFRIRVQLKSLTDSIYRESAADRVQCDTCDVYTRSRR